MRKTFPLILAICVFSSAAHALFPIEGLPPPDPVRAKMDNACALIAASLVAGVSDEKQSEWIAICSRHIDKEVCEATRREIIGEGKAVPAKLVCRGGG